MPGHGGMKDTCYVQTLVIYIYKALCLSVRAVYVIFFAQFKIQVLTMKHIESTSMETHDVLLLILFTVLNVKIFTTQLKTLTCIKK